MSSRSRWWILVLCVAIATPLVLSGVSVADDDPVAGDAGQISKERLAKFFKKQVSRPPIPRSFPDSSGKIAWARSLLQASNSLCLAIKNP